MSALRGVDWQSCVLEPFHDPELESWIRRELGTLPVMAPYLSPCPWVARSLVGINHYHALLAHTDSRLAELITLVVSQDNSCRYCYAAQRALLRIQGFSEKRIRQLEGDLFKAELAPRDRTALEFARRLSRGSPLMTARELDSMRTAGWDDRAIKEIAFVAASAVYFNRVATLPAIPPERMEQLPDRWWVRLLAPLIGPILRRRVTRRGRSEPLEPEERTGPYAYLVLALEGLPAARAMRRILDEAFASPILGARAKALIFAVIARGLACSISEAEATRLLREQGFPAQEVQTTLAYLASPALDRTEAALVPLARETIHYRPAQIQDRTRALLGTIGVQPFLEFTGLSALANAVCRLSVVADLA